jgi:P4 family phage/plasmid primase-like protien
VPSDEEVTEWWSNGHPFGIALICGAVSGNLEMCEVEGKAIADNGLKKVYSTCDDLGAGEILDRLLNGYSQESPSGGLHLLYRISDHPVPGNEKLARTDEGEVLAETRGEGGYVIGAPSPGACHPSGRPWVLTSGEYGVVPLITWAERCLLHEAIRKALDCPSHTEIALRPPPPPSLPSPSRADGGGVRPGDEFEEQTSWSTILEPHGWRIESQHGATTYWTRPGKNPRDGASATTGHAGDRDRLYVFSTSTVFPVEQSITKFRAYSILNHGGDDSAAARSLAGQGFGSRSNVEIPDFVYDADEDEPISLDDIGNGNRLQKGTNGVFVKMFEENVFYTWDGRAWVEDFDGGIVRAMIKVTDRMLAQARETGDDALMKWAKRSRNLDRLNAAIKVLPSLPGGTARRQDFDIFKSLLNVRNGVLDLHTGQLLPHDPKYRMTRVFGASFNPQAQCPEFTAFMEAAVPDPQMRAYVQRALGYSLLGEVDQRAMFLIYGPSGTGKSTLMETMRAVFADYGTTAAAGAFREHRDSAPSNDLHNLRGKRFVTTSETAETTNFNEDLLKRLTGQDSITSRELYQKNQEWVPECVLWLATNHPPKFTSDDDAIWRRAKLIPFVHQFLGSGQVMGMARKRLIPEADGILNWLLAGVRDYLEHGLMEPSEVAQESHDVRIQSDSASRFIDDKVLDGVLLAGEDRRIRIGELYQMYLEWARQVGERNALGTRRFANRLQSFCHLERVRDNGQEFWVGVGRAPGASILGHSFGLRDTS